ncbi:hypothetical protein [Chondrinema litorale]|uniref:hypothetical protein n=1 Tax=Chondrinema litorale TaxID=2994555 RepID=UPI002543CA88|nr:hypothetical protein [Chondrinema litorale]UZR99283.1 hypothetical protein OQ292_35465 [Chondrinema litorale]
MLKAKVILFLLFTYGVAFSQGGWDIVYIPIDSIDSTYLLKEIRIDFKSNENDTVYNYHGPIVLLISGRDTINLNIDGEAISFIEEWKIYDDEALLREQYLISTHPDDQQKYIEIKEMELKQIKADYIFVTAKIHEGNREKSTKIKIQKDLIKGILIKG